jgi:hypothetical protein
LSPSSSPYVLSHATSALDEQQPGWKAQENAGADPGQIAETKPSDLLSCRQASAQRPDNDECKPALTSTVSRPQPSSWNVVDQSAGQPTEPDSGASRTDRE